jgi:hypothetical protein
VSGVSTPTPLSLPSARWWVLDTDTPAPRSPLLQQACDGVHGVVSGCVLYCINSSYHAIPNFRCHRAIRVLYTVPPWIFAFRMRITTNRTSSIQRCHSHAPLPIPRVSQGNNFFERRNKRAVREYYTYTVSPTCAGALRE